MSTVKRWQGWINSSDLHITAARSSGPGGQNVNKVSTKAVLRFDIWNNQTLSSEESRRFFDFLTAKYPSRLSGETQHEYVLIQNSTTRSLETNKQKAIQALIQLITNSLEKVTPRKRTKPTKGSIEERLKKKRRAGEIKQTRRRKIDTD